MSSARKWTLCLTLSILPSVLLGTLCAQPQDAPRRLALLVGINKYENRNLDNLEYAERDVEELAKMLEGSYQVELEGRGDCRLEAGSSAQRIDQARGTEESRHRAETEGD
jgi:hypothetical protein